MTRRGLLRARDNTRYLGTPGLLHRHAKVSTLFPRLRTGTLEAAALAELHAFSLRRRKRRSPSSLAGQLSAPSCLQAASAPPQGDASSRTDTVARWGGSN